MKLLNRFLIILFISACVPEMTEYEKQIFRARHEKNTAFKNYPDSPIPDSLRKSFTELPYFPIMSEWRIHAAWDSTQNIDTSAHPQKAGSVHFKIDNQTFSLQAYWGDTAKHTFLFIPFRDKNSGKITYGGGRYMDILAERDSVFLDFNLAYHPFCVYNEEYTCEIPPACNYLKIEVPAGEKLPTPSR